MTGTRDCQPSSSAMIEFELCGYFPHRAENFSINNTGHADNILKFVVFL